MIITYRNVGIIESELGTVSRDVNVALDGERHKGSSCEDERGG